MTDDDETQEPEKRIYVESVAGAVTVRDDTAELEDIEATAESLLEKCEEQYVEHVENTDPTGTFE